MDIFHGHSCQGSLKRAGMFFAPAPCFCLRNISFKKNQKEEGKGSRDGQNDLLIGSSFPTRGKQGKAHCRVQYRQRRDCLECIEIGNQEIGTGNSANAGAHCLISIDPAGRRCILGGKHGVDMATEGKLCAVKYAHRQKYQK